MEADREFQRGLELSKMIDLGDRTVAPETTAHYEKAAAAGNLKAKALLAGMYRRGEGVPLDVAHSDALIAELAASDDVNILTSLGMAYVKRREQVTPAVLEVATRYFRRAAVRGFAPAQNSLGY